jgi:formate dehydrogenase major subunit
MDTYKHIDTVCPYCGTGCVIDFTVDTTNNRIIEAQGSPDGVNNDGRLCLKGLYGWDYLNDPQILTKRLRRPLIRKHGKSSPLEEVSWDEALRFTADRLNSMIKLYGPDTIMVAGSARGPGNEAAYITQKFARAVIGTNNVDHCARV